MRGYGFSVWLLPHNRKCIIDALSERGINIIHIPHITVKTNFKTRESAWDFAKTLKPGILPGKTIVPDAKTYHYRLNGCLQFSSKTYEFDPLNAWVLNAEVEELDITGAHLSVKYMKHDPKPHLFGFNISGTGHVVVADTRSEEPREWKLCYY